MLTALSFEVQIFWLFGEEESPEREVDDLLPLLLLQLHAEGLKYNTEETHGKIYLSACLQIISVELYKQITHFGEKFQVSNLSLFIILLVFEFSCIRKII